MGGDDDDGIGWMPRPGFSMSTSNCFSVSWIRPMRGSSGYWPVVISWVPYRPTSLFYDDNFVLFFEKT